MDSNHRARTEVSGSRANSNHASGLQRTGPHTSRSSSGLRSAQNASTRHPRSSEAQRDAAVPRLSDGRPDFFSSRSEARPDDPLRGNSSRSFAAGEKRGRTSSRPSESSSHRAPTDSARAPVGASGGSRNGVHTVDARSDRAACLRDAQACTTQDRAHARQRSVPDARPQRTEQRPARPVDPHPRSDHRSGERSVLWKQSDSKRDHRRPKEETSSQGTPVQGAPATLRAPSAAPQREGRRPQTAQCSTDGIGAAARAELGAAREPRSASPAQEHRGEAGTAAAEQPGPSSVVPGSAADRSAKRAEAAAARRAAEDAELLERLSFPRPPPPTTPRGRLILEEVDWRSIDGPSLFHSLDKSDLRQLCSEVLYAHFSQVDARVKRPPSPLSRRSTQTDLGPVVCDYTYEAIAELVVADGKVAYPLAEPILSEQERPVHAAMMKAYNTGCDPENFNPSNPRPPILDRFDILRRLRRVIPILPLDITDFVESCGGRVVGGRMLRDLLSRTRNDKASPGAVAGSRATGAVTASMHERTPRGYTQGTAPRDDRHRVAEPSNDAAAGPGPRTSEEHMRSIGRSSQGGARGVSEHAPRSGARRQQRGRAAKSMYDEGSDSDEVQSEVSRAASSSEHDEDGSSEEEAGPSGHAAR